MLGTVKQGLKVGLKTTWILGKVIFPITLIVTFLSFTPVLGWVVTICTPLMKWIGLSGEAAIPLVLTNFLNLYAGIGAILSLELTVKEVFILAVMMSFSHNLLVETAVAAKVGVRPYVVVMVRLGLALVSALFLHWFWDGGAERAQYGIIPTSNLEEISGWLAISYYAVKTATLGCLQMSIIVLPLMVVIQWMKDYHFLALVTKVMRPLTKLLGLPANTGTTFCAGLLFGLAFGAGVIIQAAKEDDISKKDLYLLFIFLVACHAIVEDTLLFIPLGISVWPLLLMRFCIAILLTLVVAFIWNRLDRRPQITGSKGVQHEV